MSKLFYGIGFDQHDVDHMDIEGAFVEIAYKVRLHDGTVVHATELVADGPLLASALRPVAEAVTP